MLDFIIHSGVVLKRAPGTVKLRVAAVRNHHLALGLPDPFYHMPRAMALAALKRRFGTSERCHPVSTRMLKWLRKGLDIVHSADAALIWAAVMLGFFFLLRASEYLDVGRPLTNRGLCCRHVVLKIKGETCTRHNFMHADEVAICIQGSKTDIFNRGEYRNDFENMCGRSCQVLR